MLSPILRMLSLLRVTARQDDMQVPTLPILRQPRVFLPRLGGDTLQRGCEVAIVVLLGLQAARLAWLLLPPAGLQAQDAGGPAPLASPPGRLAIDAFHPQAMQAASADTSGLRLFAVRPGAGGGSAIIAVQDGPQRSFAVGETIAPGMRLVAVQSDHAVVASSGGRGLLHFQPPETGDRSARPAAASAPAVAPPTADPAMGPEGTRPVDPAQLLAAMGLRPEEVDGRVTGYTVFPRGDAAVLRQAGLQAGDVLLSVNNEALDPERHAALAATLAGASSISLTFRRDGRIRSATLQAGTP